MKDDPDPIQIRLVNTSPLHFTAELDIVTYSGEYPAIGVGEYDAIYEAVYGESPSVYDIPLIMAYGDQPLFPEPATGIPSRTLAIPTEIAEAMDKPFPNRQAVVNVPKEEAALRIIRDDALFFG